MKMAACPFCGGKAELSLGQLYGKDASYVRCKECGGHGALFYVSPEYASGEKAIEAWNRRAE